MNSNSLHSSRPTQSRLRCVSGLLCLACTLAVSHQQQQLAISTCCTATTAFAGGRQTAAAKHLYSCLQELIGHCSAVYSINRATALALEQHLVQYGYQQPADAVLEPECLQDVLQDETEGKKEVADSRTILSFMLS